MLYDKAAWSKNYSNKKEIIKNKLQKKQIQSLDQMNNQQ